LALFHNVFYKKIINIRHALNGQEKQISGHKVDGYCKETITAYQFYGCFWYGCPKCFYLRINNKNRKLINDLYKNTQEMSEKMIKYRTRVCRSDDIILSKIISFIKMRSVVSVVNL
jgi:hypothetical protein